MVFVVLSEHISCFYINTWTQLVLNRRTEDMRKLLDRAEDLVGDHPDMQTMLVQVIYRSDQPLHQSIRFGVPIRP